jgi:murein DD-endopeptidase MepM/ murein hydrolase activator NlpD
MSDKIGEKSFLKKCEASRNAVLTEKQPEERQYIRQSIRQTKRQPKKAEKKYFISERFQCIINRLVKSINMSFKSNSVQVVCLSVLGFCAGVFLTCLLITAHRPDSRHGVGGLETSAEPEYEENLNSLLASVESDIEAADALASADSSDAVAAVDAADADAGAVTYQTYRVKSGDMIGFIADAFDVTQDTIISVNNIKQSRLIQPGQYLKIPSMPGIIYTVKKDGETPVAIAEKYKVNAEKCASVNYVSLNTELKAGTSLFVPDAELDWATRQEINGDLFKKPLHARYWLSSNYGWRDSPFNAGTRTFHGGLDMAVSQGTPIYAALEGKVTAVGYNATYGNYVIITHHSGYKTLYGHMKSTACRTGNFVYTNTIIGYVGSTGMSTGPHLHFTVYKNGKTINPMTVLN